MHRALRTVVVMLALLPGRSSAIQLRWSSGSAALTVATATRCTLVVQADAQEGRLPAEWRLLWVADGCDIRPIPLPPQTTCRQDVAEASSVADPASSEEVAAHLVTARFCSAGGAASATAIFDLELPAQCRGKLKVVALDPADPDSSRAVQSQEVTFNGGIDGPYPTVVLHVVQLHASEQLLVRAVGAGLTGASQITLRPAGGAPPIPLAVTAQSESELTAEAAVPSPLPASKVEVTTSQGTVASGTVPGDVLLNPPEGAASFVYYMDPDSDIYPKDFAFLYNGVPTEQPNVWQGLFHLIYIRHSRTLPDNQNDVTFGHAWSPDLQTWGQNLDAFHRGGADWDALHVWAPSIIEWNGLWRMFYTGVDMSQNQTIGYASTTMIGTANTVWQRQGLPVFRPVQTEWVVSGARDFRDPFVMVDPDDPGQLLMFYVALNRHDPGPGPNEYHQAVGLAASVSGSLDAWRDLGYYRSTNSINSPGVRRAESPHAFPDPNFPFQWPADQAYWRLMFTDGPAGATQSILFQNKAVGPSLSDTTLDNWSHPPTTLYSYLHAVGTEPPYGWEATEYMRAGNVDFMAAYDGVGIAITRMYWSPPAEFVLGYPSVAGAGDRQGAAEAGPRLVVTELVPGRQRVGLRLDLPAAMRADLTVYDVLGRKVQRLVEGDLPAGSTPVVWDGRDANGSAARTGMYFARLATPKGKRVLRLPLIR